MGVYGKRQLRNKLVKILGQMILCKTDDMYEDYF